MDERIKELEDQCWVQVPCDFDMRKGGLSTINTVFDRKKFAELIVRECIDQISVNHDPTSDWDWEVSRGNAIAIIKEHFGVKE